MRPFARGTADCCAFAAHVVYQLTGVYHLSFDYSDDEGAMQIIRENDGLSGAVTYAMKRQPIPVEQLVPGDVVLVTIMGEEAVGILLPNNKAAVMFENGSVRDVRADFIDHGWSTWA